MSMKEVKNKKIEIKEGVEVKEIKPNLKPSKFKEVKKR